MKAQGWDEGKVLIWHLAVCCLHSQSSIFYMFRDLASRVTVVQLSFVQRRKLTTKALALLMEMILGMRWLEFITISWKDWMKLVCCLWIFQFLPKSFPFTGDHVHEDGGVSKEPQETEENSSKQLKDYMVKKRLYGRFRRSKDTEVGLFKLLLTVW